MVLLSPILPPVLSHPCGGPSAMAYFPLGCVAVTSLVELLMPQSEHCRHPEVKDLMPLLTQAPRVRYEPLQYHFGSSTGVAL